jgi:hypothetical protein
MQEEQNSSKDLENLYIELRKEEPVSELLNHVLNVIDNSDLLEVEKRLLL